MLLSKNEDMKNNGGIENNEEESESESESVLSASSLLKKPLLSINDGDDNTINNKVDINKKSILKHKYLKQIIVLYLYLALYFMCTFLYDVFIPTMFLSIVQKNFPTYTNAEQKSKASYYKAYSDALPFVSMFLFGSLVGVLSDKYGRKPTLYLGIGSILGDIISCFISIKTNNIYIYFIFHTIGGLNNVATSAVFNFIYDVSEDQHISLLYSLSGLSMGIGTVIGSIIFSFVDSSGSLLILYISFGIGLLSLLTVPFLIETISILREKSINSTSKEKSGNPLVNLKTLFTTNGFITWMIILFFFIQYFSQDVWSTFYYYSAITYGWGNKQTGLFVLYLGITTMVFGAVISPTLLRYLSSRNIITLGLSVALIARTILTFSKINEYMFIFGGCLCAVSPIVASLVCSVVSKSTPTNLQGFILTGMQFIKSIGSFIGALVASGLLSYSIDNRHFYFPQAIYLLNAGVVFITLIGSIIIWRFYRSIYNKNIVKEVAA